MKTALAWIGGVVFLVAVILFFASFMFGSRFFGLEMNKFFKPKEAAMEREVFENTPSFIHGKNQHLTRLRLEYEMLGADEHAARVSLRSLILSEAAAIDWDLLQPDLQKFLGSL